MSSFLASFSVFVSCFPLCNVHGRYDYFINAIIISVRDYQESKNPYSNYVITFLVITPLKRNAPSDNFVYHAKLLSLNLCI